MVTYGEAKIDMKRDYIIKKGVAIFPTIMHLPRMSYQKAVIYYNQKISNCWI